MKKKHAAHKHAANSVAAAIAFVIATFALFAALDYFFPDSLATLKSIVSQHGLAGDFVLVFLGSTPLPFPTDAFFISGIALSNEPVAFTLVAILAAFIAGLFNYALALLLSKKWVEKQVGKQKLAEAKALFDAYGAWAILFFGAIPFSIIVDPLIFVAGVARMDFKKFVLWMLLTRIIHFGALAVAAKQIISFF